MTKKILALDTESTIYETGNPFSRRNRLMCVSTYDGVESRYFDVEHSGLPYGLGLRSLRELVEQAELLVGFNIKFDLHWLRRYIPDIKFPPIWDCQLAEFLLHDQRNPYPSLSFAARSYNLGDKIDTVATEYWDKGIDTDKIPEEILREYCTQDTVLTYKIYEHQKELLKQTKKLTLFRLQCADALTLAQMEFNGILFDKDKANELAHEAAVKLSTMERDLSILVDCSVVNWNSPHHVSAVLYGGTIGYPSRESVVKVLKSGQIKTYERNCVKEVSLPRLVEPLHGTQSKVRGSTKSIWSTAEPVLRSLKARGRAKKIIDLLLEQSELEKLRSTYYLGLPDLHAKMAWEGSVLHGTFNQCVARTGRLSCSKPNLQNFAGAIKPLFHSRNGILINTDAKGLEWVCAAYLSGDEVAIAEILRGDDHHDLNQKAFGLPSRIIAKIFMFRLIYGGTAWSYANDPDFTPVSTREAYWQDVIDKTYDKYRGLKKWHDDLVRQVTLTGKLVMPTGRVYRFERVGGEWPRTQILNYPVQGFGADLLSIVRVSLEKRMAKLGLKSLLVSTIHDSILLDAYPEEKDDIVQIIDGVFRDLPLNFERLFGVPLSLPLRCETSFGTNWGEMEVIK